MKERSRPLARAAMVNVAALTKQEAIDHLRRLGEEPHPKWSSIEIKSRIRELAEAEEKRPLGVNSNSKKEAIVAVCQEKGIHVGKHDTKGSS